MPLGIDENILFAGVLLYIFILLIVSLVLKPIRRAWKNANRRKLIAEMRDHGLNVVTRAPYGSYHVHK